VTAPALAVICIAFVILTIRHRRLFAFLLTIAAFIFLGAKLPLHLAAPMPVQDERMSQGERSRLIVVPEPDPASRGILLDRWARASAPLVPLN
jgi:hypothetical protein